MIRFLRALIFGRTSLDIRPNPCLYFDRCYIGEWDYYAIRIAWLRVIVSTPK